MAVGITLETVAAPGATPIATGGSSAKSFCNDYYKLVNQNISSQDRKMIQITGLIYKLANAGGANYKTNHAGLRQDAMVYTGGISRFDLEVAMSALDWNTGKIADNTLSTDVPTLIASGPKLDATSVEVLDRIIAFLRAQMRT